MATLDKTSRDRAEPLSQATEKRRFRSEQLIRYLPLILLAIIIVVVGLSAPNFLTARNAINILRQSAALALNVQAVVTLAPGVYIIPEVGYQDFMDGADGQNQGYDWYAGAKWQIDF